MPIVLNQRVAFIAPGCAGAPKTHRENGNCHGERQKDERPC
jgi:hypothetical protein